jgi:hypothetical protein
MFLLGFAGIICNSVVWLWRTLIFLANDEGIGIMCSRKWSGGITSTRK